MPPASAGQFSDPQQPQTVAPPGAIGAAPTRRPSSSRERSAAMVCKPKVPRQSKLHWSEHSTMIAAICHLIKHVGILRRRLRERPCSAFVGAACPFVAQVHFIIDLLSKKQRTKYSCALQEIKCVRTCTHSRVPGGRGRPLTAALNAAARVV